LGGHHPPPGPPRGSRDTATGGTSPRRPLQRGLGSGDPGRPDVRPQPGHVRAGPAPGRPAPGADRAIRGRRGRAGGPGDSRTTRNQWRSTHLLGVIKFRTTTSSTRSNMPSPG
jgi:hypothetical protein